MVINQEKFIFVPMLMFVYVVGTYLKKGKKRIYNFHEKFSVDHIMWKHDKQATVQDHSTVKLVHVFYLVSDDIGGATLTVTRLWTLV